MNAVVREITGGIVAVTACRDAIRRRAEAQIVDASTIIYPAVSVLVITISLRPATARVLIRSRKPIQCVIAKALGITQATARVADTLEISIIRGRAVAITQSHRARISAGRAHPNLRRLQTVIEARVLPKSVAQLHYRYRSMCRVLHPVRRVG